MDTAATPVLPASPGVIRTDESYTLSELRRRLGLNDEALRQARRRGLKARKVGRRKYYLGSEVIAFLRDCCPQV